MQLFDESSADLPDLVFYIEYKGWKSDPQRLKIRNQPLQHESKLILKAVGDALSEVRHKSNKRKMK